MPVINRIRIANINYDGKYIGDEIYDTYDGENTLMNLKNAGGKSVLVQLMLQPIIPGISIHGRKVESYLQQNKPSIIMLEWKLDNTPVPTYFLTAVVMRLNASDEKSSSRVNYFTFVNRYTEACEYDIAHLPLISHSDRGISIMSYNDCRNAIKNTARPNSTLNYFSSDDTGEYKAKQEQNGIFPDEWMLIARCNEEEGGISKMLETIKTSDSLFNEWILKTVTSCISSGGTLTEMFFTLIKSINENDENIRYKGVLESFLNDNNGYVENLEKLMEQYDAIEKQKAKIADIYHFLGMSARRAEDAIENCNSQINYNLEMIKRIQYEELSYEYHNAREQYLCACDDYGEAAAEKEKAQKLLNDAKRYVALLNSVELYNELKKYKACENSAREELRQMEKGPDPERYNDLVFSLRECYSERIRDLRDENIRFQQTYDEYAGKKSALQKETEKINNIISGLSLKTGELGKSIQIFEEYQDKLLKKLDVTPVHLLDDELDKDSVNDIRDGFSDKRKQLENDLSETQKKISDAKSAILSLEKEKTGLNTRHTEISVELNAKDHEIKEYEDAEKKALDALKFFEISETELFDRDAVMQEIETAEKEKNERLNEYRLSLHRQEQYLESVKAGTVHISSELSAELRNRNIDLPQARNIS